MKKKSSVFFLQISLNLKLRPQNRKKKKHNIIIYKVIEIVSVLSCSAKKRIPLDDLTIFCKKILSNKIPNLKLEIFVYYANQNITSLSNKKKH